MKKLHTIFINCTAYAPLIYIEKLHKHYLSMHFSYGEIKIMDNTIWGIKKKLFKFPPEKFLNYDTHTPPQKFFFDINILNVFFKLGTLTFEVPNTRFKRGEENNFLKDMQFLKCFYHHFSLFNIQNTHTK